MSQVKDIINGIQHRLPDRVNIYPALNRAVRMVSKRLFYHKSTLIQDSLSVSVSAGASSGAMPADFWALMEKPYISGETCHLDPVPDQETKLAYTQTSKPLLYELVGTTMNLYPGSSSAITIKGAYWARPAKLSKPTDTMPYSELFDDVIQEALIHTYITGDSTGNANDVSLMQNFIDKAVDEVVPELEIKAPQRVEDNAQLDALANEDWY